MASFPTKHFLLVLLGLLLFSTPAVAFGAGNIASISKIEGRNWRHGDIEDVLKTIAFLKGRKWASIMVKRVYFGNWLRDYSQAVDVASLKGVQAETIRVLVWVLGFMSFGYATGEFEVTAERLGVYRPEEHIDNPKDYADNEDARRYDPRLRPPVMPQELAIDMNTGMKNYIANEHGGWATSIGYVKHSLNRSIHYGRVYVHGSHGSSGNENDLCEALRCLGQALHTLEDFAAHSNYCELVLREMGFNNVFPHCGASAQINLHGRTVFPLITGSFGGVDFLHSVIGEFSDHFAQSEIDEVNTALVDAMSDNKRSTGGPSSCDTLTGLMDKVPGLGNFSQEARRLQAMSDAQAAENARSGGFNTQSSSRAGPAAHQGPPPNFDAPPGSVGGPPGPNLPGTNMDPATIVPKIYPILVFRDNVVRNISNIISKIPGLESLLEQISERITLFVLSLLAPFVQPLIAAATNHLKQGSSAVVKASENAQFAPWTDPTCTDPTHSLLSKDHFSNILNEPAGQVAAAVVKYVAPRIVYAWEHPDVAVPQVLDDVCRVFHHPTLRDRHCQLHTDMFSVMEKWVGKFPHGGRRLDDLLSSDSVKHSRNHMTTGDPEPGHGHGHGHGHGGGHGGGGGGGRGGGRGGRGGGRGKRGGHSGTHSKVRGSPWEAVATSRDASALEVSDPSLYSNDSRPSSSYGADSFSAPPQYYPSGFYNQQPQSSQYSHKSNYSGSGFDPSAYGGYANAPVPAPAPYDPNQASYTAGGNFAAGAVPGDPYAYPTAYQQGGEVPYHPPQPPPDQSWGAGSGGSSGGGWFDSR